MLIEILIDGGSDGTSTTTSGISNSSATTDADKTFSVDGMLQIYQV